jgi:hypothetical protein
MLELDDADNSDRVADWVELELSLGEISFSKSKVTSIIRDATGNDPSETFISDVWRHLRGRVALYYSPFFEIRSDLVVRRDEVIEGRLEYEICLFFSLYGASNQAGADPKLFERMVAEAIGHHINGDVFVFGWPALPDVETAIAARVKQVSGLLRERFVEAPAARYKDRGVDIISWKPFAEPDTAGRRSGQIVILSQCAAGHDWRKKTRELPMAAWTQYIHWATDPIRGFAVPCVIGDAEWHEVSREVEGLVFDRVRLLSHLAQGVQDNELKGRLTAWRTEQLDEHRV